MTLTDRLDLPGVFGRLLPAFMIIINLIFQACGQSADQIPDIRTVPEPEQVLVRIGDAVITKSEFLRRAEYTPRPPYCRSDNNIHKKIILNSLIAEKLIAMEWDARSRLKNQEGFQDYLQGREEQAMRTRLFELEGLEKVQLTNDDLEAGFNSAGRTYQLAYFAIPDSQTAMYVSERLMKGDSFEDIFNHHFAPDTIPRYEMNWNEQQDPALHQALFSRPLNRGDVVGPIRVRDGSYLLTRVIGWNTSVAVTEQQKKDRWEMVEKDLTQMTAQKHYGGFVSNLMKGREMVLNDEAFRVYVEYVGDFYLRSKAEKEAALNAVLWDDSELTAGGSLREGGLNTDAPLLTLDGEIWTTGQIQGLIRTHPLVFRKNNLSSSEFPGELKLAVADLLRDHFLNQEARKRGLDQDYAVRQDVAMWRDHFITIDARQEYLQEQGYKGNFSEEFNNIIQTTLNPWLDSLQVKYSSQITVNTRMFNEIQLSRVDMFVSNRNAPYSTVVPTFPVLTTDPWLDYGQKMDLETAADI